MTYIHEQVERARAGENPKVVTRLASGWVVLGDTQFLRGYCLLLPDPVVGSLNELTESDRGRFLTDMTLIGDALNAVCQPRRVNYDILGNLEPALHAHVFPRYESEPEDLRTRAVWNYPASAWTDEAHLFDATRHEDLRRRLAAAIARPTFEAGLPLWREAASFAARVHAGQVRKDGSTPYFAHPVRVAMTVRDLFGCSDAATIAAALLHDVIEDSGTDYDDIVELAGVETADLVAALSKDARMREDEREVAYDAQLAASDWRARLIKLGDVYDNLSDWRTRRGGAGPEVMIRKARRAIDLARADSPNAVMDRAIGVVEALITREAAHAERPWDGWDEA